MEELLDYATALFSRGAENGDDLLSGHVLCADSSDAESFGGLGLSFNGAIVIYEVD